VAEGLHVAPQAGVLLEAERVDGRQVIDREPVIPYVGISNVVPDAELAPAPVDVDEVPEGLEGAAVVEIRRPRNSSSDRAAAVVRIRSFAHAWNRTRASKLSASTGQS